MKYLILSDIHGSSLYCQKALQLADRYDANKIILLGDILYHGPRNDLPPAYAPKEVIKILNGRKQQILCVQGNCEAEVDQAVLDFPIMARYMILVVGSHVIYITHGDKYNIDSPLPLMPGDILLHGHTHIPAWKVFGSDNLYLNPGSVSIPKAGSPHSCMLIDENTITWHDLNGGVYHTLVI